MSEQKKQTNEPAPKRVDPAEQPQLDDEALEDLKIELIDSQRVATDEQGTVLVWTGEAASPPAPASAPAPASLAS